MAERPVGSRGEVLRVELSEFRGHTTLQIRRWYPDGDALKPGRGTGVPPSLIPWLRQVLEQAEQEALEAGLLAEQDYELVGEQVPQALLGKVA